jgi:hypothetical protein
MERHKHVCSKRRFSQAQKETLYLIVYRKRSGRLRSLPNGMGRGVGTRGGRMGESRKMFICLFGYFIKLLCLHE